MVEVLGDIPAKKPQCPSKPVRPTVDYIIPRGRFQSNTFPNIILPVCNMNGSTETSIEYEKEAIRRILQKITNQLNDPLWVHRQQIQRHDPIEGEEEEIKLSQPKQEVIIPPEELPFMEIEEEIKHVSDLIKIADKYEQFVKTHQFSIRMNTLIRMKPILVKLNSVIGMESVKTQVVDQILSSLQSLYDADHRFHTVVIGPPGVGKTTLANILGELYLYMGILKPRDGKLVFRTASRSDLIGKFLGHTAAQTQEFIDECEGGVLFIDEVYSLGNSEKRDSFAKECIDTLNLNLTEKENFVCIIAGYQEEIDECFFAYNPGLKRRFNFAYNIEEYEPEQLADIFQLKIDKAGWSCDDKLTRDKVTIFMREHLKELPHFGGDVETLLLKCQTAHGRRVFGKSSKLRRIITNSDLKSGFKMYQESRYDKDIENDEIPKSAEGMYM